MSSFVPVGRFRGSANEMARAVDRLKPDDVLLCYLTGVKRWVGALRVHGRSKDQREIWSFDPFPERVDVSPIVILTPENGVQMSELEGKVDFFARPDHRGGFKGFLRMSPNRFKRSADGKLLVNLLRQAAKQPVSRPVDPKQLARKPFYKAERKRGKKTVTTIVSVPESEELSPKNRAQFLKSEPTTTRHIEIQYLLLDLGRSMGFELWVARNDRQRSWNGNTLGRIEGVVSELPTQFNVATHKTIELIDVLWLKGNSIIAAFEVECTTSVYSGLLRMSDLLALQPNISMDLYLVAPDERRDKVESELLRPTFKLRETPLNYICGFIGFDILTEKISAIRKLGLASSLKPNFIRTVAQYFLDEGAYPPRSE
jgi:hypothetical protein